MRFFSILSAFPLFVLLAGPGVQAQMSQCARDCMNDWCTPICQKDTRCRNECILDCKDACTVCEVQYNCPDDLPEPSHLVLSGSSRVADQGLWATGTKEGEGDDESGVRKAAVVPKFTRLNEALWRENPGRKLADDKGSLSMKLVQR
ncbi:hypothetical protein QBC40DRAFT_251664 [Triangularia verruculosa]|uniref:Uncharacterized protein n=1 Tax=Triangularia verruculosa TaxID=2587418 RepID=A0AAN6XMB9_9PEZI|nr:hypothetical protein QBC40DRAFT_251664 [Triangularia verruculosa]